MYDIGQQRRAGRAGWMVSKSASALSFARVAPAIFKQRSPRFRVGLFRNDTLADEVQQIQSSPRGRYALDGQRASPANHRLAGFGIDENVIFEKLHVAECAAELRLEGFTDCALTAIALAVELIVDAI